MFHWLLAALILFSWWSVRNHHTDWKQVREHLNSWEQPPVLIYEDGDTPHADQFDGFYAWVKPGKGKITEDQASEYRGRIRGTLDMAEFSDRDLVIEAIIENLDEKKKLFKTLDAIVPAGSIIASNTSSLPIMEMAAVTGRESRIAGLHFFNPVPVMKLVEIVKSIATSDATVEDLRAFATTLGKTPIVAKDIAGFVVNFLLLLIFNVYDQLVFDREERERPGSQLEEVMKHEPLGIDGLLNFGFLGGIVAAIFCSGQFRWPYGIQEGIMLALAIAAYMTTPAANRAANKFTFGPIIEVAVLFIGIFITMAPALQILNAWGAGHRGDLGEFGMRHPWEFFWASILQAM